MAMLPTEVVWQSEFDGNGPPSLRGYKLATPASSTRRGPGDNGSYDLYNCATP